MQIWRENDALLRIDLEQHEATCLESGSRIDLEQQEATCLEFDLPCRTIKKIWTYLDRLYSESNNVSRAYDVIQEE